MEILPLLPWTFVCNGSITSESEQTIYVGNLGDIGANDFPDTFDYIALGHLHRARKQEVKIIFAIPALHIYLVSAN